MIDLQLDSISLRLLILHPGLHSPYRYWYLESSFIVYWRNSTCSWGWAVLLRTAAREKFASCHVDVSGRCGSAGNRGAGTRSGVVYTQPRDGKNADSPNGPEEVTSALMTGHQLSRSKTPTAISAIGVLEGQAFEHRACFKILVVCPKGSKAFLQVQDTSSPFSHDNGLAGLRPTCRDDPPACLAWGSAEDVRPSTLLVRH